MPIAHEYKLQIYILEKREKKKGEGQKIHNTIFVKFKYTLTADSKISHINKIIRITKLSKLASQ